VTTSAAPSPEEVRQIVDAVVGEVWRTYVGLEVEPAAAPGPDPNQALSGRVEIHGAWNGLLVVTCPSELARQAGAALLGVEPSTPGELMDMLGEVTNITGGNLVGMLPGLPTMSVPTVEPGPAPAPGTGGDPLLFTYACGDQTFTVALIPTESTEDR
jgi:chemotaxis protein CheX